MDEDKAIRAAKLTLGGMLEKQRAREAKRRAPGQIAPSKYLPDVPRQAHAYGGYVPAANLPVPRLAVAKAPIQGGGQPSALETLAGLADTATGLTDTYRKITGKGEEPPAPQQAQPQPQDSHAGRAEAGGGMSPEAVAAYNALLEAYGQPLTVVSDYRTPSENAAAKGAKGSQHLHGNAYDIDTSHLSHEERLALADQAWDAGFRGFGFYNNNMHFDVGGPRAWGPDYHSTSIPDWAQSWVQKRYGYADGGPVEDDDQNVVNLNAARATRDDMWDGPDRVGDMMSRAESARSAKAQAYSKAVSAGMFDNFQIGDKFIRSEQPYAQYAKPFTITDHIMRPAAGRSDIPENAIVDGHFPQVEANTSTGRQVIDLHRLADPNVYTKVGGRPRVVKADGGPAMFEGLHEDLKNDEGKPLDLYHGTPQPQEFEAFDDSKLGGRDAGFFGRGHYLTPERGNAEGYADPDEMGRGTVMGPLHAALKNPYVWDTSNDNAAHRTLRDLQSMGIMRGQGKLEPWDIVQPHEMDTFMRHMQARGHDGVIVKTKSYDERPHSISEVVVFKPNMIKHKEAEVFDPNDPRIRRNDGGRVNLYSKAAKIIRGMKDQKMDVDDILKYAEGKGVKKAEMAHVAFPRGTGAKWKPSEVAEYFDSYQPQIGVQRLGEETGTLSSDERTELRRLAAMPMEQMGTDEINRFFELSSQRKPNDTLYARYQLPGGENYREHVLTLDSHDGPTYRSPVHWSKTDNPLVHIRMSDRMVGNRKILHIEEMQSDWNNDARRSGIRTGNEQAEYDAYVAKMRQDAIDKVKAGTGQDYYDPITGEVAPTMSPMVAQAQIEKYQSMDPYMLAMKMGRQEEHRQKYLATKVGVPKAPYINPDRDDASEVAMKHILMEAAKGGYDGIAFTPDLAQEERWPGHTFKGIYDKKLPGMADKLVRQHDPDQGASGAMRIGDHVAPVIDLSPEARDSIQKNGFSSFRRGGYVTQVRRAR